MIPGVLFADDMSVVIPADSLSELEAKSTSVLNYMSKWIAVNGLILNIGKTDAFNFKSNSLQSDSFKISHQDEQIKEVTNIKFFGLGLDKRMEWKTHTGLLIAKVSSACCAIRSV